MAYKRREYHKEQKCLNCQALLYGEFCATCGQKAFFHKDSFGHMLMHFVGDYFHYDNKFWQTIKSLFTKPGETTLCWINGQRAKFLNPIQLYIFVTTVFFIFALSTSNKFYENENNNPSTDSLKSPLEINLGDNTSSTIAEYDSVQNSLKPELRDGYVEKYMQHKSYKLKERFKTGAELMEHFKTTFSKNIPKLFYVLLPIFALLLSLFFRKQKLYFVDNIIFSINFHVVLFLIISLIYFLPHSLDFMNTYLSNIAFAGIMFYLYKSLRKVNQTSRGKTLAKLSILTFSYFFVFGICMAFYGLFLILVM
jgi:hypothetical protein